MAGAESGAAKITSVSEDTLSAERACEQLGYAFFRCLDFFDQDALPDLFWSDGELVGDDSQMGERIQARHLVSNVFVTMTGPNTARGISYVCHVAGDGRVLRVGHTEDAFERREETWRFQRRRLHWLTSA